MAGTQKLVEVSPDLIAQTLLTSGSDEKNSVEGIDVSGLQNGATCYVRALDRVYRYYQLPPMGTLPVAPPTVIAPAQGLAFGRWILQPGSGSTVVGGCPTVYTVATDGSGTYPTVEAAIAAANLNASATTPITVLLCPGRYTILSTLDITNNAVDLIAESEASSFLTAAPGVSPLLRVSALGAAIDAVRVRGLVLLRFDLGTLFEATSLITALVDSCVFLAAAPGALCINVLSGVPNEQVQFVQCVVSGADPTALGAICAGGTLFADCQIQGTPALQVKQADVQLSRVQMNATGGPTVLVTGPNANLTHTDGDVQSNSAGVSIQIVGTQVNVNLSRVLLRGDVGVLTPQGAGETGGVQMEHCTYGGPSSLPSGTFLKAGSNYFCNLLDCSCNDPNVPFEQANTANVLVEWGTVNVELAVVSDATKVRWVTSEQAMGRASADIQRNDPFNALRLRQPFTPPSSADGNGAQGNIAWDKNFVYVKTSTGPDVWKRAWMETFPAGASATSGGPGFAQGSYMGTGFLASQVVPAGPPFPFDPANVHLSFDTGALIGGIIDANRSMPPGAATFFAFLVALFLPGGTVTFGPGFFTVSGFANVVGVTYYWTVSA